MNEWLAAAPGSTVVRGQTGCMISLADLGDRETLDIGFARTPGAATSAQAAVTLARLTARELEVLGSIAKRGARTPRSPPSSMSATPPSRRTSAACS